MKYLLKNALQAEPGLDQLCCRADVELFDCPKPCGFELELFITLSFAVCCHLCINGDRCQIAYNMAGNSNSVELSTTWLTVQLWRVGLKHC